MAKRKSRANANKADLTAKGPGMYYVGSSKMVAGWGKESLEEAVEHAKKVLAEDQSKQSVNVVRVVRRPEPVLFVDAV